MLASSLNDDELISILNGLGSMSAQRGSEYAAKANDCSAAASASSLSQVVTAPAASIAAPSTSKAFLDALKSDKRLVRVSSLYTDDDDYDHVEKNTTKIISLTSSTNAKKDAKSVSRSIGMHDHSYVSESLDMSEGEEGDTNPPRGGSKRIVPRPSASRSVSYIDLPKKKQTKKALAKTTTSKKAASIPAGSLSSSSIKTKKGSTKVTKNSKEGIVIKAAEKAYNRGLVQQGVPLIPKVVVTNASKSRQYDPVPHRQQQHEEAEDDDEDGRHYGIPVMDDSQLNDTINYADGGMRLDSVESDTRLKTLKLRLAGGQLTIKVLESQLNEAALALTEKQGQLDNANRRIRLLEKGVVAPKSRVIDHKQSIQETARQEVCRLKRAVEELTVRFDEEAQRRQHADARAKMLKEHIEKVKAHCVNVDCKNAELAKAVNEVEVRITRYRKDNREMSSDAASLKIALVESELDREQQRVRADRAEVSLRGTTNEIERLREELRLVRIDNHIAQERISNATIELSTAREAEAMLRTELRYKDSKRPPMQPPKIGHSSATTLNNENHNTSNTSTSTATVRGAYVYEDNNAPLSSIYSRVSFEQRPPIAAYQKLYGSSSTATTTTAAADIRPSQETGEEAQSRIIKERKGRLALQAINAQSRSYDSDFLHGKASAALPVSSGGRLSADMAVPAPARSSFVRERVIRSASPSPAKRDSAPESEGGVRMKYERLQKMYERVTGRDAKLGWKNDSDSDMD